MTTFPVICILLVIITNLWKRRGAKPEGYYANVYVFVYNKDGALLGSVGKTTGVDKAKVTTSVNKSKTTKATGVHYVTSKKHDAGDVYGYKKITKAKGGTY